MNIQSSKYYFPAMHVLVWGLLLAIPAFFLRGANLNTGLPPHFFLITNLYHIGLFYLNAYFLYPRLMNRRFWWLYFAAITAIIAVSWFLKLFYIQQVNPDFALTTFNSRIIFFPPFSFLLASFIFRWVVNHNRDEKNKKEAEAERMASELKFLRSQVSPHFLFNMMTNMVSLARQKSDLLEPALIKLSGLLRYMLYETGEEKFTLNKELEYLEGYIELQQLRFGENVEIRMDKEFTRTGSDCVMEPMLLIPFVENAFKHGIGMVEKPFIRIKTNVNGSHLFFSVSNNYNKENFSKDKNSGIGLVNVQNRLKLLYPGKYALSIQNNGEIYSAELNLDLSC